MVKKERQRYIFFKIIQERNNTIEKQELLNAVWYSIWKYFGMKTANKIGLWLIEYNSNQGFGIFRCSHETKEVLISALTLIREINKNKIILAPMRTSGTIKKLKQKINEINL